METLGRGLLIFGLSIAFLGLIILALGRLGWTWRPLPGDIVIHKPGLVIAFPFMTMLILSLILTLILNFIALWRR